MSVEQKTAPSAATNADAEKDVQDVLAELKEEAVASTEKDDKEDAEEARIVAEATKLGEKSEKAEQKFESSKSQREWRGAQRGDRGGRTYRNNTKFDASTLKETDDPVEIRKQVCSDCRRHFQRRAYPLCLGRILLLRLQPPNGQVPPVPGGRKLQ